MCRFILILRFLLSWPFLALLGLPSAEAASGFYLYSNYGNSVRIPSDGSPNPVCDACANETLCHWAMYDQHIVSLSYGGNASKPQCSFVFKQGSSGSNQNWLYSPSGTYYGCPSDQSFNANNPPSYCTTTNSCIANVTVAGSGSPAANPGYANVGKSITYCSTGKCVVRAWESIEFSTCLDNSTSCAPSIFKRSEGILTGDACTTPAGPPDLPSAGCSGGMSLMGGVCVCPAGARVQGGVCRQNIDCSTGYHRVNDSCIADACPAGEIIQDNRCIPDPRSAVNNPNPAPGEPSLSCASGRHYDTSLSSCVANTAVNGGTSGSPGTPGNPNSGSGSGSGGGFPGESGSAESSDCAQPPVCAGDAVQCALLTQVWRNHCDAVPDVLIAQHPVPPVESVDVGASATSALSAPAAVVFNVTCPVPVSFTVQGHQYQFEWQPVCTAATSIRPVLIAIAYFLGLLIVAGVRRGD